MLSNPTKNQTDTVSPTKSRKIQTRPINKIGTSRTSINSRQKLFCISRSNYGQKDKTVEIALDARKLNDSYVKKRPHMPNMEELLNQISAEISNSRPRPNLDIRNRSRLCIRTDEIGIRNQ